MSPDGTEWLDAAFPSAWDRQAPFAVAQRGRDIVTVLGPLESVNGPADDLTSSLWLGSVD